MATLQSKKAESKSKSNEASHRHSNLEGQLAELKKDLVALTKKCSELEGKLNQKQSSATDGDYVSLHSFRNWQKKVAKKLGIRL